MDKWETTGNIDKNCKYHYLQSVLLHPAKLCRNGHNCHKHNLVENKQQ